MSTWAAAHPVPPALSAEEPAPAWLVALRDAYGRRPRRPCPLPDNRVAVWLWPVLDATLAHTTAQLQRRLDPAALGVDDLPALLSPALPWDTLVMMADRTALLQLHIDRLTDQLQGDTAAERSASFLRRLAQPELALAMFERWPALGESLQQVLDGWSQHVTQLLCRLVADRRSIEAQLVEGPLGALEAIGAGLGDAHRRQQSVAILRFASGQRVVYKPRSLALDQALDALLRWVVHHTDAPPARRRAQLVRPSYGWERYVPHEGCEAEAEVALYLRRLGHLAALFTLLDGADLHLENVRAWRDTPVAVDPECLFQPRAYVHTGPDGAPVAPADNFHSVLHTGLVPVGLDKDLDGAAFDLSGLSTGAIARLEGWEVEAEGTDEARMVRRPVEAHLRAENLPTLRGQPIDPGEHEQDFLQGFREATLAVVRNREAFVARVEGFAELESRILVRDTQTYAELLEASFHPDHLRDPDSRRAVLERLGAKVSAHPHLAPIVPLEVADLMACDVPVFTGRPGHRHLDASDGTRLPDANPYTAMDILRARLARLRPEQLRAEALAIRSSFALRALNDGVHRPFVAPDPTGAIPPQRVEEALRRILDDVVAWATLGERYAFWTGLRRRGSRWSAFALGMGLQSGSVGIGLVLQEAGRCLGEARYARVGRMGVQTGALAGARELAPLRPVRVELGFRWGWGGTLFGIARSLLATGDPWLQRCMPPIADHLARRVLTSRTPRFAHGFGGTVWGLQALDQVCPLEPGRMHEVRARAAELPPDEAPAAATAPGPRGGWQHGAIDGGLAGLVLDALDDAPGLGLLEATAALGPRLTRPLGSLLACVEAGEVPCANPLGIPTPDLESGYVGVALALLRLLHPEVPALHRGVLR